MASRRAFGSPIVRRDVSAARHARTRLSSGGARLAEFGLGLRARRDALAAELSGTLPDWRFRLPRGGLALWCELPEPLSSALTVAAERQDVILAPGASFAPEGGLERFLRLPYTRSVEELTDAVSRLATAWQDAQRHRTATSGRSPLVA